MRCSAWRWPRRKTIRALWLRFGARQRFASASGNDWLLRFWLASQVRDYADTVEAVDTLARRWPTTLNSVSNRAIFDIQRNLAEHPNRDELLVRMFSALHQAAWRPDPFVDNSPRWRQLAELLLAQEKTDEARRIAADIRNPMTLAQIAMDRRFDGLMNPGTAVDWPALFEADLERARTLSAAHPDRLEGVNEVAQRLIRLDRGEEALVLLDAAIERAQGPRGRRFSDQDEQLNWTRNSRAYALKILGRGEEALAEMRRGARLPESGRINVSQTFNLAVFLLDFGSSQEAIAALAEFDFENDASGYGWMVAHRVLACANVELGKRTEGEALLAAMRTRRKDSRAISRDTELCFGNIDEAARLLIEDLEDADERADALREVQEYRTPQRLTAFEARIDERKRAVLARSDVRAAVERHGRVLALPITGW